MGGQHIQYKHHTQDFVKYRGKLILTQNSEIYTSFTPGLLNVNKPFHTGANSLTPEGTVHNQNKFKFMKFTINMQITFKKNKKNYKANYNKSIQF